jgi:Tyosinase C-terminal domain
VSLQLTATLRTGVVTPFTVSFYYGPTPNGTSQQGIDEPNFIGSIPVIPMPLKNTTGTSYNQLPLSPVLANGLNSNAINSLDESEIVPLLTEKLSWVVVDTNGNVLDIQEVIDKGGLTITVAARDVEPLQNGQENAFPQYSDWQEYDEPTQGKPGGVRNCGCY